MPLTEPQKGIYGPDGAKVEVQPNGSVQIVASTGQPIQTTEGELRTDGPIEMPGTAAPDLSEEGEGRIYFDETQDRFLVSEDGGAYTPLAGTPVTDATITTTDVTTNNASITKHGWLKKLSNVAAEVLDGQGAWRTIAAILGYTPANAAALGVASATSLTVNGVMSGPSAGDIGMLLSTEGYNMAAFGVRATVAYNANKAVIGIGGNGTFNTGMQLTSDGAFAWGSSTSTANVAPDTTIARNAPGVVQFGTNAANALGKVDCAEYRTAGTKVLGAQGAAVADATDAGSAITQLNLALARLRAHGIIAT
jgi:hypothetical protein